MVIGVAHVESDDVCAAGAVEPMDLVVDVSDGELFDVSRVGRSER